MTMAAWLGGETGIEYSLSTGVADIYGATLP